MGRRTQEDNKSQIFNGKWIIEDFDTPEDAQFYCGSGLGVCRRPTAIIRCFVKDGCLYIDKEAEGMGRDRRDRDAD
jgi:phage terminase large subunit